ncbi:unnamed protein product, partial [marine sediment metagenome]
MTLNAQTTLNIFFFGGLVLLALGCWFVYRPLAAIVPGAILVALSVFALFHIRLDNAAPSSA